MTKEALSAVRRAQWKLRKQRWGPSGSPPKQPWRRKPSARAKRIAKQMLVARVSNETPPHAPKEMA